MSEPAEPVPPTPTARGSASASSDTTLMSARDRDIDKGDKADTDKGKSVALSPPDDPFDSKPSPSSPSPTPETTVAVSTEDAEAQREPDIYDRFSPSRKSMIVAIVSYAAFIGPIASSAFLPSIKVMADEMHTTPSMISYTVAIFVVSIGIAPLVWSPLSGFYGRKPVYLMSMPIMTVASVGVAQSHTVGAIIGTRILQGIGSSAVLSVGAGTVGDIYRPTERANAMAWFYSGVLLGPALSPVLAGVFTEYTSITWRATQYFLCAASALSVLLIVFFLPETSHPVLPHEQAKRERGKKFVLYLFNPLTSLGLMQYSNIVVTTVASSCIMLQTYAVMVPLTVIFQDRYNITNVAIAGCVYLSVGVGTLIGSRIGGPLADRTVRIYIEKRGYRRPEDRLHAALWGAGLISPASCLVYGWLLWSNKGGMAPPLVMLVINGIGMQLALTPVNTYLVDSAQKRSAEAIAVNNFWRYMFAAAASAFVLPMVNAIGTGWTMTFAAGMGWLGFVCIVVTMRLGERWRDAARERIARRHASSETLDEGDADAVRPDEKTPEVETKAEMEIEEKPRVIRPGSPIGVGIAARDDDAVFLDDGLDDEVVVEEPVRKEKKGFSLGDKLRHLTHSRRGSVSSEHDHGEAEHGEPTQLVQMARRPRAGTRTHRGSTSRPGDLNRERSRRGSTATLPSVGDVLQRTVSLSGASVHGG